MFHRHKPGQGPRAPVSTPHTAPGPLLPEDVGPPLTGRTRSRLSFSLGLGERHRSVFTKPSLLFL